MNYINNDFIEKRINIFHLNIFLMLFSLGLIAAYVMAFYTEDGDIMVNAHDNLDSNIAIFKLLSDTKTFFSPNDHIIENVMNGIPRATLPRERNVVSMLYYFFEPIDAYMINEALIRLIAFLGMLLLLKKYFLRDKDGDLQGYQFVSFGAALTFSLLPYWSNGGLSVAGQPLVLYAFLNIKNGEAGFKNWLLLAAYPFYSSLILAGMFLVVMFVVMFIYDWVKNRAVNLSLLMVISFLSVLYLFAEYRHVDNFLDPLYVSHREEFLVKYLTLEQSFIRSADLFFKGQSHANSIHGTIILPFIFIYALIALLNRRFKKVSLVQFGSGLVVCVFVISILFGIDNYYDLHWKSVVTSYLSSSYPYSYICVASIILLFLLSSGERVAFYMMSTIVVITIFGGFEDYQGIKNIKESFSILSMLKFDRFYFLLPLLWFLLFSLFLKLMLKKNNYGIFIVCILLLSQGVHSARHHGIVTKNKLFGLERYYSHKVYEEVKVFIAEPVESYRVMHLGLPPAVSIYNGFYTLDAYLPSYPLEYKHEFREIIADEIEKNSRSKNNFDNWGSRCRLRMANKESITLNLDKFKAMGGKYIFSQYDIEINNGEGVKLQRYFADESSHFSVYLYQVM